MNKKLTELEIVTYLRDFTMFISYITTNPNEKFDHIFTKMLNLANRGQFNEIEYYYDMLNVTEFFILNKYYSFLKDTFFDYLLEQNIERTAIPNTIFINSDDSKYFSKRQIINNIRNAINHSNHNKLYTLSKENNILYIEIKLSKTKPIPFHIKMTLQEYSTIMSEVIKANRMDFKEFIVEKPIDIKSGNLYNELDNILFKQYLVKNKIGDTTMKNIRIFHDENKVEEIKEILKTENITITQNKLTTLQKNCIIEELKKWSTLLFVKTETILKYALYKVIPNGKYKLELLSYLLLINENYLRNYTNTYNDVIYGMLIKNKEYSNHFYDFFKDPENNELLVRDLDNLMQITITILISYIFENLITEKQIKIGESLYETERIRNSMVHGKWFLGQNGSYKLFDNHPSDLNELNYIWKVSIPFKDMIMFLEQFYKDFYKNNKEQEENNNFMEISIFETYSKTEPHLPNYLTFVKKQRKFVFNLNVDDYSHEDYMPWNLYKVELDELIEVSNEEERKYFYSELDKTQIFTKDIIEFIKNQYVNYLKYKENLITKEQLQANDEKFKNFFLDKKEIKLLKKEKI